MSGPPRPVGRPSPVPDLPAPAAPAPHNTGAGSSMPSLITLSQTGLSPDQGPSPWHFQMALAANVLRTLNGMVQEEVQRQRLEQQASSSAEEGGRGGHIPPSMRQPRRANMEVINALCYEIQVLFPIIVSNYPLAGPKPTAPLIEGHGTDAIAMVYASRIETILRRHSGRLDMLETFQQQLQAVLLLHTHNTNINASHEHLIRELRQLIAEENERGRPGVGRRHQTNPSQVAQGITNVLRAARDVEPADRGETAALREMIRDFGEVGVVRRGERSNVSPSSGNSSGGSSENDYHPEVVMRAVSVDRAEMDDLIRRTRTPQGTAAPSSAPSGATAIRSGERSDESPPSRGDRSQNISNREGVRRAGIPGTTAAPAGGARNVLSATRGRTGGNNNTRGAHVPSAAHSSGPAQGGNPQGDGTGNGHASSPQRRGQSRRS
jgi:hypothetical protein